MTNGKSRLVLYAYNDGVHFFLLENIILEVIAFQS